MWHSQKTSRIGLPSRSATSSATGRRTTPARAERAQWQASLLAEASRVLAASLDYDATLDALMRLTVPTLGDWVTAHLVLREGGTVRRIGPAYADPRLAPLAQEVRRLAEPRLDAASGTVSVLQTGAAILVPDVSTDRLAQTIQDPAYRDFVLRLAPRSLMIVPMVARGRTLGALTFVAREGGRRYTDGDVAFAEDLGRRAGVAVDNARLYRQTEQAKHEAEAANLAKDEFLAVLSHELRTPLNAVLGWLTMVEAGTLKGEQAERAIATVSRNVVVLRRLIEDLLDVSGIIAGKLVLVAAPCDLGALVEQTIESLEREAAGKGLRLAGAVQPAVVVNADTLRLRQVVGNLVSNAIKFTGTGGEITVTLRTRNDRAVLGVRDTDLGITPEVLPHVFERFRQADSSSTRHHGGLGLGLAIVKHLVELHGGVVRVESPGLDRGSTFTVELPLVG